MCFKRCSLADDILIIMCLQLTQINEKLSQYSRVQAGGGASATVLHTLQRHWDILQDYSHEFHKIRTNVCAVREREELLDAVHRDRFAKYIFCVLAIMFAMRSVLE